MTAVAILAELVLDGGRVVWQARRSGDRDRLEVVVVVAPSPTPTIVAPLTVTQLRALLADSAAPDGARDTASMVCSECGTPNDDGRRWCRVCSCALNGGAA